MAEILHKPETLRKMLDEHGVEHYDRFDVTEWVGSDGEICHTSVNYSNGATVLVLRKCTTPEQAIAATLGRGECELINAADDLGKGTSSCMCSECGYTALDDWWDEFKYCPNCGRRVVEVNK